MSKYIDISGQKFGRLTVLKRVENTKDGKAQWLCRCDCGNTSIVTGKCLRNGHTKSCGCYNKEITSKHSLKDLIGLRFGRLTVINRADDYISPKRGKHHVRWNCLCDCGANTIVESNMLTRGRTKSCGCLRKDVLKEVATTHGGRRDRLYRTWANIKNRCYNMSSADYKYYGGRGIQMCDEWRSDYATFKEWAYQTGYDENAQWGKCTIDRIDVNGNYEPLNCRWVDMKVQSRNRRNVTNK